MAHNSQGDWATWPKHLQYSRTYHAKQHSYYFDLNRAICEAAVNKPFQFPACSSVILPSPQRLKHQRRPYIITSAIHVDISVIEITSPTSPATRRQGTMTFVEGPSCRVQRCTTQPWPITLTCTCYVSPTREMTPRVTWREHTPYKTLLKRTYSRALLSRFTYFSLPAEGKLQT